MRKPVTKKPNHTTTLFLAVIITVGLAQPHAGFLLLPLLIPLAFVMMQSLFSILFKPGAKGWHLARLIIWLSAIATVVGVHYYRYQDTRQSANEIVAKIEQYTRHNGHCPDTLDDIGINPQEADSMLGSSGYMCANSEPTLFYIAPFIIKDRYVYNFTRNVWEYQRSLFN